MGMTVVEWIWIWVCMTSSYPATATCKIEITLAEDLDWIGGYIYIRVTSYDSTLRTIQ